MRSKYKRQTAANREQSKRNGAMHREPPSILPTAAAFAVAAAAPP